MDGKNASREAGEIVADQSSVPATRHPVKRFQSDYRKRYPEPAASSEPSPVDLPTAGDPESPSQSRLHKLPPEIGVLLIVIGAAGIMLPGPVGSPFLLAGGIALWPAGFRKVEHWFMRTAPGMYDKGIRQIEQFLADLERRYPGSVR
jgi:hypothetical protein